MRKTKSRKERFFIRMWKETKKEADWLYFESFADKNDYEVIFFFARDPSHPRRFCICEAKTGRRFLYDICKLDEITFWKFTAHYIMQKEVREAVLCMKRVSRLPDYVEEEL